MTQTDTCPHCGLGNLYPDGALTVCADCGNEWTLAESADAAIGRVVRDANGNVLTDGDSVSLIKDLKPKGGSSVLKIGTRFKSIRLVDGDHDVDVGEYMLKSAFLKKQS